MRTRLAAVPGTVLAAAGVVVVGLAALLAAHQPAPPVRPEAVVVAASGDGAPTPAPTGGGLPWWVLPAVVLLVLLGLTLFWFVLRDLLLDGDAGRRVSGEHDTEREHRRHEADLAAAARRALVDAADSLDRGRDPREVVVACWVRIEDAAASEGLGRRPAETATDVARRWLAAGPDRAAVDDLAALYHLARYSTHPLTDAHRDRARAAVRGALGPAAGPAAARPTPPVPA